MAALTGRSPYKTGRKPRFALQRVSGGAPVFIRFAVYCTALGQHQRCRGARRASPV